MEINLICVGKIKEDYLKNGINEYLKRLKQYVSINIIEVNESLLPSNYSNKDIENVKINEGKNILKHVADGKTLITLDLNKKEYSSEEFADFIKNRIDNSGAKLYFAIGGSYGLSEEVKNRASYSITLSKMTFTHQMTRLIILEQLYRAFKINNHEVYHK